MQVRRRSRLPGISARTRRGMTLIELMIGLAVLALMLLSGAPAFSDWLRNAKIRSAAESMLSGIQYARTEAVRRNMPTRFQLVSSLDAQCTPSPSGQHWVVTADEDRQTTPSGRCHKDVDASGQTPAFMLQKASAASGNTVAIDADRWVYSFNSVGQQIQVDGDTPPSLSRIDITSPQGGCHKADGSGGTTRCLRIEVSRGGQARLCDPGLANTPANQSMACQ